MIGGRWALAPAQGRWARLHDPNGHTLFSKCCDPYSIRSLDKGSALTPWTPLRMRPASCWGSLFDSDFLESLDVGGHGLVRASRPTSTISLSAPVCALSYMHPQLDQHSSATSRAAYERDDQVRRG